jgi:hypothetical protein
MAIPSGGAGVGVGGAGQTVQASLVFEEVILTLLPQLTVNGAASVEHLLQLPRTAVVEPPYLATVYAGRADWTRASNVGRVRQQDVSGSGQARTTVIVDFGVLRTVAAVGVLDAFTLQVIQVKPWTGIAFAQDAIYQGVSDAGRVTVTADSPALTVDARAIASFSSEIKTERLQIDLVGKVSDAALADALLVQLPDVPSDLELRINGGLPVWSAPGAVATGTAGWQTADHGLLKQSVDLSAALTALLSDPTASPTDLVDLHLVLSARVPGALTLEVPTSAAVLHITRVNFEQGTRDLTFAEEGRIGVALPLPTWAKQVARLQGTVLAKLPPLRVLPPVGPDAVTVTQDGVTKPFAELVLDPDHAAAVALPGTFGLAALTGVRVPLRPDAGGAEARVLLLQSADGDPGAPVDGGVSQPVTLPPPTSDADVWTTFSFPQPVKIEATALPFVGVVVTRGKATWAMTDSADGGQAWRGPPTGPLQELPTLGALAALHARARVMGTAPADQPVAPLLLNLGTGPATPVSPTPKGVPVELRPPTLVDATVAGGAVLDVVSRVAGTVTLKDVLAVVTNV